MNLNEKIDAMREDIIKSTQEIVKIKSLEGEPKPGMPFGEDVAKALQCALDNAERLGLKIVNVDGYVGYAEIGEGEDYVAALGHLDVVPEGDGWIYPPYGGEIHDGKIFGRGTLDDKGPIVACLYGLKAIKDANLPLSKRIRVIFGTNEETGSKELHHYLQKEKPPVAAFTPDANFPIINGEKGITIFNLVKNVKNKPQGDYVVEYLKGGVAPNMVPDYAEAVVITNNATDLVEKLNGFASVNDYKITAEANGNKVTIKSVGVSAHGSTPELGKNAIMQIITFLNVLPLGEDCISTSIKFLAEYVGMELHGESFGVLLEDKDSGKLSFNLGKISIDEKKVVVTLNLRYPVTKTLEDMMTPFNKTIANTGFVIENFSHQEPLYFSPENSLVKTLQKVYAEQTGKEAQLISIGGGTYAKEMPNTLAFGPTFPGDPDVIHKPNEYVVIEDLIQMTKIYTHALFELAK
ncbi:dipeptidase PepV [Clostridium sp.]|uniref:dipeptidase PepV n=1 Tax=Clostridium sp. TaxID=1506 RepID=UPI002FC82577